MQPESIDENTKQREGYETMSKMVFPKISTKKIFEKKIGKKKLKKKN